MAGHRPWREIRRETRTYWSDLRFSHDSESPESAADAVDALIEEAETRGFKFELGNTTPERPLDAPFR